MQNTIYSTKNEEMMMKNATFDSAWGKNHGENVNTILKGKLQFPTMMKSRTKLKEIVPLLLLWTR